MTDWHIAQLNIATARYHRDDQRMRPFFDQIEEVNELADNSDGFIWRLQTESGNATDIQVGDDPFLIVNMSVWETSDALFNFAYKSAHRKVFADRRDWFVRPEGVYQVLWWLPAGQQPSVDEGMAKLELLRVSDPAPAAFTFKSQFPPPGT